MKANKLALLSFGLSLLGAGAAIGQTATTEPVGFVSASVLANSDATLAVPMNRTSVYKGVIQSITGNVVTVAGTSPAWVTSPMQFVQSLPAQPNTYAAQLATGAKEGQIGRVTANGVNTLTISFDAGDDLTGVKTEAVDGVGQGDHIDVMAYWTPKSLFTSPPLAAAILGFSNSGPGFDRGPADIFAFDGTNWQDDVNGGVVDHTPLPFGTSFVLRNNSASVYNFSMVGSVPMTKFRVRLATLAANTTQDIQIGYVCPIPESLTALEFPAVAGDSILGFDNSEAGIDKGPLTIWAYDGTKWVDDVLGGDVPPTTMLQPGVGYIFRKNQTVAPQSVVWTHLPGYLQ
jgi:uncharacterized protein (TIGR02597 family)